MQTPHHLLLLSLLLIGTLCAQAQQNVTPVTPDKGFNYVILDAAGWGEYNMDIAKENNPRHLPLFNLAGAEPGMEYVTPYLFALPANTDSTAEFITWITRRYSPTQQALYLYSTRPIDMLRKHLATLIRAKTESGGTIIFRLYDPAILPYMIPQLSTRQAAQFFASTEYISYRDVKTEEEVVLAPSPEVQAYLQANKGMARHSLEFSDAQLERITKAMQAYHALECPAAHASLGGRKVEGTLPVPVYKEPKNLRVMVEIEVNPEGKVTKASAISQGMDVIPYDVRKAAETAALATRFAPAKDAPAKQQGNIVYHFEVITK